MLREAKAGDYELYAAADGVIKVTSGVERRILHALQDGDFTPTELSYVIGRSRSTLSEYLNKLERDGLIASVTKDEDGRSKVYTLLSDPLVNTLSLTVSVEPYSAVGNDAADKSPQSVSGSTDTDTA